MLAGQEQPGGAGPGRRVSFAGQPLRESGGGVFEGFDPTPGWPPKEARSVRKRTEKDEWPPDEARSVRERADKKDDWPPDFDPSPNWPPGSALHARAGHQAAPADVIKRPPVTSLPRSRALKAYAPKQIDEQAPLARRA